MGLENNILEGWIVTTLGDVCENISRRFNFKQKESVVFVNTGDVLNGKFLHHNSISKEGLPGQAKKAIEYGDILYSEIRPANKRYALVDFDSKDYVVSTKFMVLKKNNKIDLNYFYLFLKSSKAIKAFQSHAEARSGTFPQITFDTISGDELNLPPLPEQKAIAQVLTTFDDKIELLHAQNKTLTTLSQTIFKEWFIDFNFPNSEKNSYKLSGGRMIENDFGLIPEGWSMKTLEEIADFQNGYAFYTIGYESEGKKVVDLLNIDQLGIFKESPRDKKISLEIYNAEKFKKFHLLKNDLVMAMTDMTQEMGILGKCGKIKTSNKFILNQRIGRIRAKEGVNVNFLMVYLNSKYQINHLKKLSLGTVQKYVNTNHIKEMQFIIPSISIMNSFASIVDDLFKKIDNNDSQIQSLTKTRDTLLPKLMSGKVRVNNLKQTANA